MKPKDKHIFECLYFVCHSRTVSIMLFGFSVKLKRDSAL